MKSVKNELLLAWYMTQWTIGNIHNPYVYDPVSVLLY